jgi:hypothetical protein
MLRIGEISLCVICFARVLDDFYHEFSLIFVNPVILSHEHYMRTSILKDLLSFASSSEQDVLILVPTTVSGCYSLIR